MFTYNKYCMLSNLEILNEAKKIIDDNPVNISEEYHKKAKEMISPDYPSIKAVVESAIEHFYHCEVEFE